jgi:surfeit locus 1 family protein
MLPSRLKSARLLWPTVLAMVGLGILIGLGTWQMQRRTWKDGIIARLKQQQAQPPVPATAIWPSLPCRTAGIAALEDPCEYQPVSLRGVFDHGRERHIFTASPRAPGVPSTPSGYWVFTPMRLEGGSRTVYINRGFVPEERKDQTQRILGQPTQAVDVVGLYRSAQKRAMFDGANDPPKNIWYVRDPAELWPGEGVGAGEVAQLRAAYVDMTGPIPAGNWPLPLGGKVELSNRHLEYALTWYGLAGTLIAVFAAFAYGRLRAAPRQMDGSRLTAAGQLTPEA